MTRNKPTVHAETAAPPEGQAKPNPFRTLDSKGRPVESRFSCASAVREVYRILQEQDDGGEAPRRAKIRRMYDFFRPFDPDKLKAAGLANLTNVNTGELAGQIDARAGAINDMALDTTDLVELHPLPAELAGPDAARVATVIAEEFSAVLRGSAEFLPAIATMVRECDLYGIGPIGWRDPYDFMPVALERGQVKFPDDASTISSNNELIMVESQFPAWYLIRLLDNPEKSERMGWNVGAVRDYLKAVFLSGQDTASQAGNESGTSAPETLLAHMRQNRLFEVRQFEVLRVIHAYAREVSGERKITHYIVPTTGGEDDFLFYKPGAYENMDQCVQWLPYKVTEPYARSQRGLASAILPLADVKNRVFCRIVDAAINEASQKLEATSANEAVRDTVIERGGYTFYTGGVRPVTSRTAPDFSGLGSVHELIGRISTNNVTGAAGPAALPERIYEGADRKTKDQIQMEARNMAKTEQALFVLRSTRFDAVFRECFRRFMGLVVDARKRGDYPGVATFIDRCRRREVSMEMLRRVPEQFEIYMCRDLVIGGANTKAGIVSDMLERFGGNLDEAGRIVATRDYIKARAGVAAADRYRPEVGRDEMPGDAASHALLENNAVSRGEPVLVGRDQLHWAHIPVHAQIPQQIVQAVQAGQVEDAALMLQVLQSVTNHIEEHANLGGMQIGKAEDAKAVIRELRSLRPVAQALTMMAQAAEHEREAEARRRQKEMEDLRKRAEGQEAQAAMHDSDNKAAVKMYEVDKMAEVKAAAASASAQTEAFKARSKAATDRIAARYRSLMQSGAMSGLPQPGMAAAAGPQGAPGADEEALETPELM